MNHPVLPESAVALTVQRLARRRFLAQAGMLSLGGAAVLTAGARSAFGRELDWRPRPPRNQLRPRTR